MSSSKTPGPNPQTAKKNRRRRKKDKNPSNQNQQAPVNKPVSVKPSANTGKPQNALNNTENKAVTNQLVAKQPSEPEMYCDLCDMTFFEKDEAAHTNSPKHVNLWKIRWVQQNQENLLKDKGGIRITEVMFPTLHPGDTKTGCFKVSNVGNRAYILSLAGALPVVPQLQLEDRLNISLGLGRVKLLPGTNYDIFISYKATSFCHLETSIIFVFDGFRVMRKVTIAVSIPTEIYQVIKSAGPYEKNTRRLKRKKEKILFYEGEMPAFAKSQAPAIPKKTMGINDQSLKILRAIDEKAKHSLFERLGVLNPANFSKLMRTLTFAEMAQLELNMSAYTLKDITLKKMKGITATLPFFDVLGPNPLFRLQIPGLEESRPSVLKGDRIILTVQGQTHEFWGYVHHVNLNNVDLSLPQDFIQLFPAQTEFYPVHKVHFTFNKTPAYRCLYALEKVTEMRILFPSSAKQLQSALPPPKQSTKYNEKLNEEQRKAVDEIISMDLCFPRIIFGPPGTGKTVTLVESIRNILQQSPSHNVLVCTPSNTSADLILDRLSKAPRPFGMAEMIRIYALSKTLDSVPSHLREFAKYNREENFFIPPPSELKGYRIVVTTLISAGSFAHPEMKGHFSHICIDEAGQATEAEVCVAFQFAGQKTRVILAGDPKQLDLATKYGYNQSHIERLCTTDPLYSSPDGVPCERNVSMLTKNYRSHPSIINTFSPFFYGNKLTSCGDPAMINSLVGIELLPNPKTPIIFHGIQGKDERETTSPSWFNTSEIGTVLEYVEKLTSLRSTPVTMKDIGIISPYKKQCEKLRRALSIKHRQDVQVGSVEQFQGSEKLVIIITTVRSSTQYLETDFKHNLGFLQNPKRFNVAVSRPKALLIVVGSPQVLSTDKHWGSLLKFCIDNGCYVGPPVKTANDIELEFAKALSEMRLDEPEDEEEEEELPEMPGENKI